jgi:hypothetical protein
MELDLTHHRWLLVGLAVLLSLVLFGWIGAAFTPEGEKTLTWTEWQVLKAQRTYQQELGRLQSEADALAELLNAPPDPVRSQIVAERIQRLIRDGQPALQYQREKLVYAAQGISYWAVGAGDREAAVSAFDELLASLTPQPGPGLTPASEPGN